MRANRGKSEMGAECNSSPSWEEELLSSTFSAFPGQMDLHFFLITLIPFLSCAHPSFVFVIQVVTSSDTTLFPGRKFAFPDPVLHGLLKIQ